MRALLNRYGYHLVLIVLVATVVVLFRWNPLDSLAAQIEIPVLSSQPYADTASEAGLPAVLMATAVSYTHLTLPTNREV